jgi:probable aminopeptidase NPEPL1
MASITVNFLSSFKPAAVVKHVLSISSSADRSFAPLRHMFAACKVTEPEWLAGALANLKPLSETANTVDFLLPSAQEGNPFVKFVVAVLPTACSRANTVTNAHVVGSVVKANKGSGDVVVVLSPSSVNSAFAQACAAGRNFPLFSMKSSKTTSTVDLVVDTDAESADLLESIRSNVDGIRTAQRLVDMPPNLLHVDSYIAEARAIATKLGCQITVIQGAELEAQGFGGLFGVGKASEHPPALVVLSHIPAGVDASAKSVCMVGKGIVYDTGGLSIKTPTTSMAGMKMDMGGSAAVLCSFAAALTAGYPLTAPLHALLCLAENSVDERSIRPDDILTMLSGKTVEVNNTDAEGRLVLADGCFYASKHLNPRVIIDIATLTGAQLIATGKKHAALYCNDDDLESLAVRTGRDTGDLTHPLPYCPEFYKNEFRSQVRQRFTIPRAGGMPMLQCCQTSDWSFIITYKNAMFFHAIQDSPISLHSHICHSNAPQLHG